MYLYWNFLQHSYFNLIRYNAAQNAIEFGNVEVFKMLLKTAQHGEDFFITLRDTEPPLHRAFARQHKKEIIEILLNHGVDVNAKFGQEEHTALHKAVVSIYDDKDIVELLLENHADLNMVTACGETPLNMAIREDNVEIARSLLKYGADATKPGIITSSLLLVTFCCKTFFSKH